MKNYAIKKIKMHYTWDQVHFERKLYYQILLSTLF